MSGHRYPLAFLVAVIAVAGGVAADPPKSDAVLLPNAEYQKLLDAAKPRDAKPVPPSECHIRATVEDRGGKPVAVLTVKYVYRTTTTRTVVALGGQRVFLAAVAGPGGKPVPLTADGDGLTVTPETAGDHALTLSFEAPLSARGGKGELGFEAGFPKAAITTLAVAPPAGTTKLTVATRGPGEPRRTTDDAVRWSAPADKPGVPLGPVESVEVSWPATTTPAMATESPVTVDADIAVRIDDTQVETTAKLRLRGAARDWQFTFPPGASVAFDRSSPRDPADPRPMSTPTITRPADATGTNWTASLPDGGEWVATVTVRQTRPDPKAAGPYPVGPFAVRGAARQTGVIKVFAPVTLLPAADAPPEVARQDVLPVTPGDDPPAALYRYAAVPVRDGKPVPLLDLKPRTARGFVLVVPVHKLRLAEGGWRLRTDARVTPVRSETAELLIEVPAGWQNLDVQPPELVEEVRPVPGAGPPRYTVRLVTPRKEPFDLVIEATYAVPPADRAVALLLPRFPTVTERAAQVTATVADGFEVRGGVREWDGKQPAQAAADLTPPAPPPPGAAVTTVGGKLDGGAARVDLSWRPYRPEMAADLVADVTPHDRQLAIAQTIKLTASGPLPPAVRFTGPPTAVGVQSSVPLTPTGPGEWTAAVPAGSKDFTVTIRFAVPMRLPDAAAATVAVPLLWPDATRATTAVRVLGGGLARRVSKIDGPWRELPPDPATDRDALPLATLTATGVGLPLAIELAPPAAAAAVVERAAVQAWVADDGAVQARGRFVLRRWSASGVELDVPAVAVPVVFADHKRLDGATGTQIEGVWRVRLPLPEPRAGRPSIEIEVRYAPGPVPAIGETTFAPAVVCGAVYRSPVRWHLTTPASGLALLTSGGLSADLRWRWQGGLFAPGPANAASDLDAWLAGGADPDLFSEPDADPWSLPAGETLTGRQAVPTVIRVVRVPRVGWVIGVSLLVFLVGVGVSRLRPGLLGPAVGLLGVGVAIVAAVFPQPTAHAAAAAEPGAVAVLLWVMASAGVKWYQRRQVTHLSAFSRGAVLPSGTAAPAGSRNGSSSPPSVAAPSVGTP